MRTNNQKKDAMTPIYMPKTDRLVSSSPRSVSTLVHLQPSPLPSYEYAPLAVYRERYTLDQPSLAWEVGTAAGKLFRKSLHVRGPREAAPEQCAVAVSTATAQLARERMMWMSGCQRLLPSRRCETVGRAILAAISENLSVYSIDTMIQLHKLMTPHFVR